MSCAEFVAIERPSAVWKLKVNKSSFVVALDGSSAKAKIKIKIKTDSGPYNV